jgi:sRNA-binding regulator protein Hfq
MGSDRTALTILCGGLIGVLIAETIGFMVDRSELIGKEIRLTLINGEALCGTASRIQREYFVVDSDGKETIVYRDAIATVAIMPSGCAETDQGE